MNSRLFIALCIVLHAILVLVYAAILATYKGGVYDRPLHLASNTVRTVMTIVSQSFTIVYCAILVLLTQRITLHEFLRRAQTLTAIHDKSSAWLGLASSLQVLGHQRKLVTDFLGISMIASYLLLIFVVHTTLPSIFGVTTQNVTVFTTYPTTLARQPFVTSSIQYAGGPTVDLHSILSVYDMLNISTVGISSGMIYDIIPAVANATGTGVEVNATTFSVDCAALPDAVQIAFQPNITNNVFSGIENPLDTDGPAYYFEFGGGEYVTIAYPMTTGQFQVLAVIANDAVDPSMLVVASTYPVIDSAGNNATMVSINPGCEQSDPLEPAITGYYFISCNFNSQNSTVFVNSQSGTVEQSANPPASAQWHNWIDPGTSLDPLLRIPLRAFADSAPASNGVVNTVPIVIRNSTFNMTTPYQSSVVDDQGAASIPSSALQERLTVNTISLYVGLGASCILFVLAVLLTLKSGYLAKDGVYNDISGLLPMLWLLGNKPRLAAVEQPELDALRAAGMYEVAGLRGSLRQRVSTMKGRAEEESGSVEVYELDESFPQDPHSTDRLLSHTFSATTYFKWYSRAAIRLEGRDFAFVHFAKDILTATKLVAAPGHILLIMALQVRYTFHTPRMSLTSLPSVLLVADRISI
ncbi:hypothetical protein NM688_g1775 [Phlebia brevispora]|uniref:Uncharacterized protein n=1 Tax=Phlebia brevispora TaxID=194682 RepID=A0ACC1TAJ4_9APHY|nr:hypothetical protein NM688_g1775 [Phlebia brevispora]